MQILGALAVGAVAVGAVAVGALAIGSLAVGRARIRRLEIDELVVRKLRITEEWQVPSPGLGERGEARHWRSDQLALLRGSPSRFARLTSAT